MKLEMTQKDKKLLTGLAVFVIIVCFGYWGIFPVLMELQQLEEEIAAQEDFMQKNTRKIGQLSALEADNRRYEEEIPKLRGQFYPMMTSDQIDKEFTGRALNHNLLIYDMTINVQQNASAPAPYRYSGRALHKEEAEEERFGEQGSGMLLSEEMLFYGGEQEDITGVCRAGISLNLSGKTKDLQDFLEELLAEGIKLRLCSFGYENARQMVEGEDNAVSVVYDNKLSVRLEIYMCEE